MPTYYLYVTTCISAIDLYLIIRQWVNLFGHQGRGLRRAGGGGVAGRTDGRTGGQATIARSEVVACICNLKTDVCAHIVGYSL